MSTTTFPTRVSPGGERTSGRIRSLVRGRAEDPAWARPALIALLAATAIAYLWNLTASGDANSFYAAAVQAGTKSWKAFFFGSLDSSNFITVDKPPASLWVMALSGRIFGFSSASMLVPQVLEGVVAVGLLAASLKRWFGAGAGLLAGAALALTPVAALMFRFNNPDALLVCLLVASAYCLVRALENGSTRWMIGVGALIGFAFLAKMMQAFLVVPGFALVYLVAAPVGVRRRVSQLLAGGVAMVASAGWWVAIVALWPASSRPMIDGSSDNSILNLIVGYNGLGRLTGGGGPGGGGGGGGNFSGSTGVLRLFNDLMGGQASWLLPAALLALVAGLAWRLRAPRTDRTRTALLLWGGWLVVSGLVFSLSAGVIHTYYTVALAPAIAALAAIGATVAWRRRDQVKARVLLALGVVATAVWSTVLLGRAPSWEPWLVPIVAVTAGIAVVGLLMPARVARSLSAATALVALVACLAGPVAYSAQTLGTAHTGSTPSAGPETSGGAGPGGGGFSRGGGFAPGAGFARGGGSARIAFGRGGTPPSARRGGLPAGQADGGSAGGGSVSSALVSALKSGASGYRWAAATSGSQSAASLELATGGVPVMAIGGFNNQGGNITLARFEAYVKAGDIHYYIASGGGFGGGGGPGGGSTTSAITSWVKAHYRSETIGGQTVYDLTQPLQS
ncbi:MAG TPA: glycosyltransferase family 39 protein [Solirubrobacteraceae bacterium]|nr:glycosyltransferase family 39 protein [Solirubrobacteraceae bacterium]